MTTAKLKKKLWKIFSEYIRQRDAKYWQEKIPDLTDGVVCCCTCGLPRHWTEVDAGHFIPKGMGGKNALYFDEYNVNAQCKGCNAFKQGAPIRYEEFIIDRYGQDILDQLRANQYRTKRYSEIELLALMEYYKQKLKEL